MPYRLANCGRYSILDAAQQAALLPGCLAGCPWKDMTILLSQLAAVQRLAAAWLSSPPMEARSSMRAEDPLTEVELMSFADQVGHDGV